MSAILAQSLSIPRVDSASEWDRNNRAPKPDTPLDSVWIVTDEDEDGTPLTPAKNSRPASTRSRGLAWKGDWLWIANAPELTRVRDTDGDDIADDYIRVYTDLGNLEHALHGLQFGPDGRLYMSKGNSKGLTILPDRIAPAPFRELWGIEVPGGTPEPKPKHFTAATYEKNYQDPRDDWGVTGGILRCNDDGTGLEIVSRGFRNPWDIAFDDQFNWLGTDNDQTMGDKLFAPVLRCPLRMGPQLELRLERRRPPSDRSFQRPTLRRLRSRNHFLRHSQLP